MNGQALCAKTEPTTVPFFRFDVDEFNKAVRGQYTAPGIEDFDLFELVNPYQDYDTTYELDIMNISEEESKQFSEARKLFDAGEFKELVANAMLGEAIIMDWIAKGYLPMKCKVWIDCTL